MDNFHEIVKVPDGSLSWIYLFSENNISNVAKHWHDCLELTLIIKGETQYTVNGRHITAREGDLLLINSGDLHECSIPLGTSEAVNVIFPDSFLTQFGKNGDTVFFHLDKEKEEYRRLMSSCEKLYHVFAMRNDDKYAQLRINSIICDIAYILLSNFRWDEFTPQSIDSKKYRKRCREIMDFVDSHYQDDVKMENLEKACSISKEHLARIFRDYMGTTYKKHITKIRMYHAYKLLTNSDLSLIEIAQECGFSDSRAFIASFRKIYGTTPGKYRRGFYQNVQYDFKDSKKMQFFFADDDPV